MHGSSEKAGARVIENVFLRDTGLPTVAATDGRRLEVVATGLPINRGVPLGVDVTVVSPLHADGSAWDQADTEDSVAIRRAERAKATTYPELVESPVLRLVTLAVEVGGRMSDDCASVLSRLAACRARSAPPRLRASASWSWLVRWSGMLAVAVQDSLAATLVDDAPVLLDGADGVTPLDATVWLDAVAAPC